MIADVFIATAAALAVVATTPAVPVVPAPPAPIVEEVVVDTDELAAVEIYLTTYTCDYHPDNVMATTPGMCRVTAAGGDPHTVGIACPIDWMGTDIYLPDWGWRRCDDTGAHPTWKGRKHLDLRVPTWAEAWPGYSGYYTVYTEAGTLSFLNDLEN